MSTFGPVLFDSITYDRHYFENKVKFTIGRSVDASLQIISKLISRHQCLIQLNEMNGWEIKDLSSFKTTRLNSKPLSSEWVKLNNNDKITFVSYQEGELIFFQDRSYLSSAKKRKVDELACDENSDQLLKITTSSSNINISKLLAEKKELIRKNKFLEEKYQEANQILKKKQKSLEETQISLEMTQKYLTETQKSLEKVETEKTTLALQCFDEKSTKENLLLQLQDYIEQLKECEMELYQVSQEKECSQENSKEICSSNEASKNILCIEFNALKEELKRAQEEIASKEHSLALQFNEKETLYSKLWDVIEQELSCSVCNDVMFQATILQCRHAFCFKCLNTWKARKKECPFCRTRIKAEVTPLVLDNLIDKVADFMGADFKKKRDDVRQERSNNSPHFNAPHKSIRNERSRNRRNSSRGLRRDSYIR